LLKITQIRILGIGIFHEPGLGHLVTHYCQFEWTKLAHQRFAKEPYENPQSASQAGQIPFGPVRAGLVIRLGKIPVGVDQFDDRH
jgi:hypothetical protein